MSALLTWVESIGCSLDQAEAIYTQIVNPKDSNRPPILVFNPPFPRNPFFTKPALPYRQQKPRPASSS